MQHWTQSWTRLAFAIRLAAAALLATVTAAAAAPAAAMASAEAAAAVPFGASSPAWPAGCGGRGAASVGGDSGQPGLEPGQRSRHLPLRGGPPNPRQTALQSMWRASPTAGSAAGLVRSGAKEQYSGMKMAEALALVAWAARPTPDSFAEYLARVAHRGFGCGQVRHPEKYCAGDATITGDKCRRQSMWPD